MSAIICTVEDDMLIRRLVVRQYCSSKLYKSIAVLIATMALERIEQMEDLQIGKGDYYKRTEEKNYLLNMPVEVSYTVFYKTDQAKEKLIDLIKNINK